MKRTQRGFLTVPIMVGLGLAFAAVVAGAWFGINAIEGRGFDRGVAEQKIETDKAVRERDTARAELAVEKTVRSQAEADRDRLTGALEAANARVDALSLAESEAQARARAALARAAEQARKHGAEVARLKSIIEGPPLNTDTAAEAEDILRRLALARNGGRP